MNKHLVKALAIYTACLCVPVFFILYLFTCSPVSRDTYYKNAQEQADTLAKHVQDQTNMIFFSAAEIFNTQWFRQYYNDSGYYDSEFHLNRMIEICKELQAKVGLMQVAEDIIVIIPSKNIVICQTDWSPIDRYINLNRSVDIVMEDDNPRAQTLARNTDEYCVMNLNYLRSKDDVVTMCVLLDKAKFAAFIEGTLPEYANDITIDLFGNNLYAMQTGAADYSVDISKGPYPLIHFKVGYASYMQYLLNIPSQSFQLILLATFPLSLLLGMLLHYMATRPLHKLLRRFQADPRSVSDAYAHIGDYMESMLSENERLTKRNQSLVKRLKHEISMGMFTDENFDFDDEYLLSVIPWINDGLPYRIVLIHSHQQESLEEISSQFYHFQHIELFENECCLLIWFENMQDATANEGKLRKQILSLVDKDGQIYLSHLLQDTAEMRDGYLRLRNQASQTDPEAERLPVSFQADLVSYMQSNKPADCLRLMREAKGTVNPEHVLDLIAYMGKEYACDCGEGKKSGNPVTWADLETLCVDVCTAISLKKSSNINKTAEIIREFIDSNFTDQDMSIKLLSEQFDLSGSLISKIFKAQYHISFSDYLLEKRIDHALELLTGTDTNLSAIAESVGYANYYSFKRAFGRKLGYSPREYREKNQADHSSAL